MKIAVGSKLDGTMGVKGSFEELLYDPYSSWSRSDIIKLNTRISPFEEGLTESAIVPYDYSVVIPATTTEQPLGTWMLPGDILKSPMLFSGVFEADLHVESTAVGKVRADFYYRTSASSEKLIASGVKVELPSGVSTVVCTADNLADIPLAKSGAVVMRLVCSDITTPGVIKIKTGTSEGSKVITPLFEKTWGVLPGSWNITGLNFGVMPSDIGGVAVDIPKNFASPYLDITHGLNFDYPLVTVYDSEGYVVVPAYVKSVDANSLRVGLNRIKNIAGGLVYVQSRGAANVPRLLAQTEERNLWTVEHNFGRAMYAGYPSVAVYSASRLMILPDVSFLSEKKIAIDLRPWSGISGVFHASVFALEVPKVA